MPLSVDSLLNWPQRLGLGYAKARMWNSIQVAGVQKFEHFPFGVQLEAQQPAARTRSIAQTVCQNCAFADISSLITIRIHLTFVLTQVFQAELFIIGRRGTPAEGV